MSSPNVSFTQIPANVRKPGNYFELNTSNAIRGLVGKNDKVILIAQKTSSGSIAEKIPTKVFSDADSALYFGSGSIAHLATRAAIASNPNVDLSIVAIDDANGSSKAAGIITATVSAGNAGTLYIWIGDVMVPVSYTATDTSNDVISKAAVACNSVGNTLPVTSTANSAELDFEAKNAGTIGNYIPICVYDSNVLASYSITAMTGGVGDPDVGDYGTAGTLLASIVGAGYTIIVNCLPTTNGTYTNMTKIKTMVNFVSGPMEQRPAIQVVCGTDMLDTFSNFEALATTYMNDGRITLGYISYATDNLAKSEFFKLAATYGAELAYNSDPAVPYDGLVVGTIAPPAGPDRLTRTQQEHLLNNGVTPFEVVPGEVVTIVRAISTLVTTNSLPDATLLDITTIRTLDYVRYQIRSRLTLRFKRSKLSPRILKAIRSQVLDVLYILQEAEIVQNVDTYKTGVIVEVDTSDPTRANVKVPSNIVSGLHVIAGVIELIL